MAYNHLEIEKKWQERWEKEKTFKTDTTDFSKPKYYILDTYILSDTNNSPVSYT